MESPLRPLLGNKVVVPCHVQDNSESYARLISHSFKWTYVSQNNVTIILMASYGQVRVAEEYQGRVSMVNYYLDATDGTMEISEVRSKDSGTYNCDVLYGTEEHSDSVDIRVQGTTPIHLGCKTSLNPKVMESGKCLLY